MFEKQLARKKAIALIESLSEEVISVNGRKAFIHLRMNKSVLGKGPVCCYVSMGNEMPTRAIIEWLASENMKVLVPIMYNGGIALSQFTGYHNLTYRGKFPEPVDKRIVEEKPTAFIVPGIAFTRQGERLGRGLGFYDRLLSQHPYVPKIGLCHSSVSGRKAPSGKT